MPNAPTHAADARVLDGRYRLLHELGRGGMGVVYAAQHVLTERMVAIKIVRADGAAPRQRARERILSEARIAAALQHPHVVDVLDVGCDGDDVFLVLELLEGEPLDAAIAREGAFSVAHAAQIVLPIAEALVALHAVGIAHRDVKPANIFLVASVHGALPKLLDFGLARGDGDLRLTESGVVVGTPLYMAPEHAAGIASGPAADVWSLGVVLYELLAGVPPFPTVDKRAVAALVLAGRTTPLSVHRRDLPETVNACVARALQRDPAQRFLSMAAFAEALARAVPEASPRSGVRVAQPASAWAGGSRAVRRWPLLVAAAIALVLTSLPHAHTPAPAAPRAHAYPVTTARSAPPAQIPALTQAPAVPAVPADKTAANDAPVRPTRKPIRHPSAVHPPHAADASRSGVATEWR